MFEDALALLLELLAYLLIVARAPGDLLLPLFDGAVDILEALGLVKELALTTIRFELSGDASVSLTVYNIVGQVVRRLIADEFLEAGSYRQSWDGLNAQGDIVGSGLYFY